MWEMYYADATAVIFVIDSADRLRMAVAKDELETILQHDDINKNNAVFLFFANKSDLPNSCTAVEVAQLLELFCGFKNLYLLHFESGLPFFIFLLGQTWLRTMFLNLVIADVVTW